MKNLNLIKGLWDDSHEKRTPQRLRRYAVMLLMLLTLGVGQMWADNAGFWDTGAGIITYSKNGGSDTNHSVNKTGASTSDFGTVTAFWLKGWQIKMWKNSSGNICDYGKLYYRIYLTSGSGGSYTELNKASTTWGDNTYHNGGSLNTNLLSGLVGGTYYFEFYFKAQGNWSSSSGCDDKYLSNGGSNYKIKFKYDPKYTVTVSAGSNGSVASTSVTAGNIDAVTLPTATANTGYHFNNWTTASSNLTLGNTTSATTGTVKARAAGTVTANFAANTYTVAYDANDDEYPGTASGSTTSSSHTYGTAKALTSNGFSRAGYTFAGWATTPTGSVAYTNGQSVTNLTSTDGATVTLYAKWLPQSLTITAHPDYLTTTDKLNLSIEYANIPSGYCYRVKVGAGYYNNSSNQDRDAISGTGSTTFTSYSGLPLGANTVVVELWKNSPFEKQSVVSDGVTVTVEQAYLVNVQAKTDGVESTTGGTVSPASVNASAHLGQTITASEPNTGYDFNGWTANTPNITFADPSALSTTVYATAGGWVYANYVRQSGSYSTTFYAGDHGSINAKGTAIAKNGSASVTIGENETLSATPESADYVFDHWGTTGSVSVANIYSATTTVTATAAGGTVTAYYKHVPVLGAVTATPSGTQNYAGSPIDFALSVTSTYMAHPVVVFLVNDGTTTYEVVGAPYGADGSSAAGTIGSDAANTTVHKATFTASAAKSYTVSAKLYEGLLLANFNGKDFTGGGGWNNNGGGHESVSNPAKQAVNGSNTVHKITRGGGNWYDTPLYWLVATNAHNTGSTSYRYIHTRQYREAASTTKWKANNAKGDLEALGGISFLTNTWQKVAYDNAGTYLDFMFPLIVAGGADILYIDDIILSNEASMTEKASQAATASFSINWNYTVTLNNNGATSAGTESVNVTYGSATGITNITVPTKTGYTFGGYYTEDAGAGTLQINASGVWQNAGYVSGGNWNSGSNQTLYAKWTENKRNVTISVSPSGAGTLNKTSASVGVVTTTTVTATAQPGYRFTGWTATNCSVASTSSASTTLSGNGTTGDATLVANFARTYAYLEGRMTIYNAARSSKTHIGSSEGGWSTSSTNIKMDYDGTNHRFYLHTYMKPSELSAAQSGNNQYFFFKTSTSPSALSNDQTYRPAEGRTLTAAGTGNKKATETSSGTNSIWFNSSTTNGYAILYFDEAGVWYELEHKLLYDGNGNTGGSTPASSGSYYNSGTNATAASNSYTMNNYSFAGWNTSQHISGTNYAAGASVPMTTNRTLYATWTRSVTLNQEDATTEGSTSVTGTWNCSTLPAITNPEKTGYVFGGWYTETAGKGNLVINTAGELQSSVYHWTDQTTPSNRFMRPTDKDYAPLYAKWTQTVTLNANTSYHGSGSNTTATIVYKATAKTSITHCAPATGYHLEGYYSAATGGTKILEANGDFAGSNISVSEDDYISGGAWVHAGNTTLYAHYEPNTYDVTLKANTGTGDDQVVEATYDAAMPTTLKAGGAVTVHTKTGYNLLGYWDNASTGNQYYSYNVGTSTLSSYRTWNKTNNTNLYAHWSAKSYTVTLDVDEANKGTIAGADESASVTFDAAPTTIANRPTAANGYALVGYYTEQLGEGTKLINGDGTWISDVAGYMSSGNWVYDGEPTLYAYYKKAAVTGIAFSPAAAVAPNTEITATPTISPTPTGSTIVCWELQYNNGTPLPSQPTFTAGEGNTVSFDAPEASATYRLQATLRTGSSCAGGTELSVYSTTFQVAGEHTVTVRYQDSDGRTIKASTEITGKPLEWTTAGDITPPTITGYKFDHWDAGDGVTIKNGDSDPVTTTTTSSIQIKAVYDGTLTAVYAKKKLIFFNNTLGWSDVYVYFYNTNKYWNDAFGAGAKKEQGFGDGESEHPYWEQEHGHMTQIEGTNIWYFDYEGAGYSTRANVAFTEGNQHGYQWFNYTKAVVRGDHGSSLQMFVPLTTKTTSKNNTDYYNSGYWMNYPENTGYTLLIYNQKAKAGATKLYEIPFEFTEDYTMPMELKVDLEAGQTYGFEIYRADGTYFSTTTTITANTSNWGLYKNQTSYCGLQTTAAGDYTFSLFYDGEYRVGVTYPVAVNDYRIVYTDLATWSKAAHTASWYHPSGVITKNGSATETKKDTVSFFWTYGSSPAIAYQTCSAVAAGSASWSASTSISVSSYSSVLTEKGIYNFIFEQPAGGASISLIGVEPYTGKYYIRTDCAGSTKWSNFQSTDHEMTYSDYTEKNHGYSHYYTHWVTTGQNVKFCIANDYSQCITDTLVEDIGTVIADITTEGNANAGRLNSGNASIRFMWNQATNKISRAYISGSTNISDRFLVLEGDAKMFDAEGNALSISGLNANEINLVDDQNFVYERTIKVQTGAKAKLTAKYNDNVQYFKGGPGTTSADSVVLLGGSASVTKHTMRIVYDIKTNRLVTAYVPEGDITEALAINADIMLIREHQEAGQQLVFKGDGALSKVKTVYGVMRFNRWTLNNKETTGEHSPVGDPKSAYERGLYWISFPFDVNLSDVFGFGTYGTHWIIMEYDGAERAQKGYWRDSEGFWKYVTNRTDKVLEAGKGYVLALDLDLMRYDDDSFWSNNIEQVELFFPSVEEVKDIESTNVTTTVDAHACTIDRTNNNGPDINKNRTRADSHWNIIGIPSYANYGTTLKDGAEGDVITWNETPYTDDLPFLYEWSTVDNTYSVQSGTTYPFKAMHAYMVQYHGDLYWSLASATPVSPIVARRTYAEKPQNVEMRIELQQNEKAVDQTFVKLSNDENVSTNFAFDEDLCKEYNANKANIYTIVENYLPVAGNTMPMSDQTTVVPVGVKIATDGEYTFAIPDGTEGIGVVLIDNIAGTRTNLGLMDYSVTLEQGQIDNRFLLEISPIVQSPTDLENTEYRTQNTEVRKVMIDGILYIVKDGIVYDAQGHRVQ